MDTNQPSLILFCGPSGSGKTTIVKNLLEKFPNLAFSVSVTTRKQRPGEVDGKDYYFTTVEDFKAKIQNGAFLEWEEVYANGFYGTLTSEIDRINSQGKVALFDVDVVGGMNIKNKYGKNLLDVFVRPPSPDDLRKRLVARATETPESLETRIAKAAQELLYGEKFTHVLINTTIDQACVDAQKLVAAFLEKRKAE